MVLIAFPDGDRDRDALVPGEETAGGQHASRVVGAPLQGRFNVTTHKPQVKPSDAGAEARKGSEPLADAHVLM